MSRGLHPVPRAVEPREAILQRVRLLARREVLWLRRQWASQPTAPAQGLAIPDGEIDRLLEPSAAESRRRAEFDSDPRTRTLGEAIGEAERSAADDPVWTQLGSELALNEEDLDLFALAAAVELDPWMRRVCGYLHDDATATHATPWLASRIFRWRKAMVFGPDSGVMRWRLATPAEGVQPWSASTPWHADPAAANWCATGSFTDATLGDAVRIVDPDAGACLYPELLASMQNTLRSLNDNGLSRVEIELVGPPGAGRRTLARQLCASIGCELLVADAEALFAQQTAASSMDRAVRVLRLARLRDAAIYWHNAEHIDVRLLRHWPRGGGRTEPQLVFLGCSARAAAPAQPEVVRRSFDIPALSTAERCSIWRGVAGTEPPPAIANTLLTPGEIAAAAGAAAAGPDAVRDACRAMLYQAPGDIFAPLPCPYEQEDLVLAPTVAKHLEELKTQARLRFSVLEDWGLAKLTPASRGISALFAGPSGTGKTMAAQVIARELQMDLYRVDLSGVINKYVGETEKRLKQVFDACERSNVILFFDEADSLFGQRTDVKDSHDRYANIEVNYLLQRMEQFDGIAILATNRKNDIDKAFIRRLRFIVDFLPPGPPERLRLWSKALAQRDVTGAALVDDAVDCSVLAERLELTGAGIKMAALNAAFYAREQGSRITLQHILSAVRREMAKHGQVLRAGDLGFAQ